ncbi:MAG: hypothetical protein PHY34_03155 [Patescibacteria group bacterium]|nr:hypothetical protein [Patescibacteria group bacterium]MDD5716126.1 hypothetical protein [Patescibacteria group bacterium]
MVPEVVVTEAQICAALVAIINGMREPKLSAPRYAGHLRNIFQPGCPAIPIPLPADVPYEPVTANTRFVDIGLGSSDPHSICMELSEQLGLPTVRSPHIRRVPTMGHLQDYPTEDMGHVQMDLTPSMFAGVLYRWLVKRRANLARSRR